MERVSCFSFLRLQISDNLAWTQNRSCSRFTPLPSTYWLVNFYPGTIESVLTGGMAIPWHKTGKAIQRVVRTAEKIGCALPSIEEIFWIRCGTKVSSIIQDHYHRGYQLFSPCSFVGGTASFTAGQAGLRVFTHKHKSLNYWTYNCTGNSAT